MLVSRAARKMIGREVGACQGKTGDQAALFASASAAASSRTCTSLAMVPALLFFTFAQRRIVNGLTGAVKG